MVCWCLFTVLCTACVPCLSVHLFIEALLLFHIHPVLEDHSVNAFLTLETCLNDLETTSSKKLLDVFTSGF